VPRVVEDVAQGTLAVGDEHHGQRRQQLIHPPH
jgi:hypothetical protein